MTNSESPPEQTFAQAFDQLRQARGLSQADVARALGVHRGEVSRWKAGGGITIQNVRKIAVLFGVDSLWLERLAGYDNRATAAEEYVDAELESIHAESVTWNTVVGPEYHQLFWNDIRNRAASTIELIQRIKTAVNEPGDTAVNPAVSGQDSPRRKRRGGGGPPLTKHHRPEITAAALLSRVRAASNQLLAA